jgi:hypothetical protein
VSDDYLNDNLIKNRSKERMNKFGDAPIEYANVAPISDLAAVTKIEKGADLAKSEQELEDILPINTEKRIITFKDGQPVEELYLIQQFARRVHCPRSNCQHVWFYKGKNRTTICPKCPFYSSHDVIIELRISTYHYSSYYND